jgi:hypothetical protein
MKTQEYRELDKGNDKLVAIRRSLSSLVFEKSSSETFRHSSNESPETRMSYKFQSNHNINQIETKCVRILRSSSFGLLTQLHRLEEEFTFPSRKSMLKNDDVPKRTVNFLLVLISSVLFQQKLTILLLFSSGLLQEIVQLLEISPTFHQLLLLSMELCS